MLEKYSRILIAIASIMSEIKYANLFPNTPMRRKRTSRAYFMYLKFRKVISIADVHILLCYIKYV